MNSLLITLKPDCSDVSLAARDLMISLHENRRIAFAGEFSGVSSKQDTYMEWPEYGSPGDPLTEALGRYVDDSAICLHMERAADIEIDQHRDNHAVVINSEDASDPAGIFKLSNMDAIWCTSVALRQKLLDAGIKTRILETKLPTVLRHPKELLLPRDADLLCVESDLNITGIMGLAKAWIRNDLADGKTLVIATTHYGQRVADTHIPERLQRLRIKENHAERKIYLCESPSPSTVDLMVEKCRAVACCHIDYPSWRPVANKAIMAGKPLMYSTRGEYSRTILSAEWLDFDYDIACYYRDLSKQDGEEENMAEAMAEPLRRILAGETKPAEGSLSPGDGSLLANDRVTRGR